MHNVSLCVTLTRMTLDAAPARSRIKPWMRALVLVVVGLAVGVVGTVVAYSATPPAYQNLPSCAHEDGNPDGKPCWWSDPDTGTRYYVTSENYR